MELVVIFASMAMICFGIAISGVAAKHRGYEVGCLPNDATLSAIAFGALALVGLFFV